MMHQIVYQFSEFHNHAYLSKTANPRLTRTASAGGEQVVGRVICFCECVYEKSPQEKEQDRMRLKDTEIAALKLSRRLGVGGESGIG